jgi:hypothetical protein
MAIHDSETAVVFQLLMFSPFYVIIAEVIIHCSQVEMDHHYNDHLDLKG